MFQAGVCVRVCASEATEGCQSMTKGRHQSVVGQRAHLSDHQEGEKQALQRWGRWGEVRVLSHIRSLNWMLRN